MRQHRPKLRPLSIVAILCVALLMMANMILIFSFSAENREESGDRSRAVTTAIARLLDPSFDDMTDAEQTVAVERIHGVVRKAAHFLEFALLGFLSAGLLLLLRHFWWPRLTHLQAWLIPAAFCLLYAASDEIHQLFTERGARVGDVAIDFCGAVFGIACLHLAAWLTARIIGRHRAGKEAVTA